MPRTIFLKGKSTSITHLKFFNGLFYLDDKVHVYVQGIEYHLGWVAACSLAHSVFDSKISNTHSSPQRLACAGPWSSLILLHLTLLCLLLLLRSPLLLKLTAPLSLGHVYLPYFSCPLWYAVQALIFPFKWNLTFS